MKKLQFFLLAAVAIVFAACSNDDVVLTDTGTSGTYAGGDGYISLAISMPDQTSTRATSDYEEVFKGGETAEYTINDATLLLFHAENAVESEATLYAVYPLGITGTIKSTSDNVNLEQTKSVVREIDMPNTATDYIYGLVVINKGNILSYTGEGKVGSDVTDLTIAGTTVYNTAKLSNLQELVATKDVSEFTKHGFLMTNSPLYANRGGDCDPLVSDTYIDPVGEAKVLTLAPLNKARIYSTEANAVTNSSTPALKVYVERAVAKVTVELDSSVGDDAFNQIDENTGNLGGVEFVANGYVLDVTNKSTYFVRNATDNDTWWGLASLYASTKTFNYDMTTFEYPYRFVGFKEVGVNAGTGVTVVSGNETVDNQNSLYRTYWAKDPNYDIDITTSTASNYFDTYDSTKGLTDDELTYLNGSTDGDGNARNTYSYCLENTFDLDNMMQTQTTRVVVQGQFLLDYEDVDGTVTATAVDIYTVDSDTKTVYPASAVNKDDGSGSSVEINEDYQSITDYIKQYIVLANDEIKAKGNLFTPTNKNETWEDYIEVTMNADNAVAGDDVEFVVTWNGQATTADTDDNGTWVAGTWDHDNSKSAGETGYDLTTDNNGGMQDFIDNIVGDNNTTGTLNATRKFTYYPNGKCYYAIRIQHFGDDTTPWESEEIPTKDENGNAISTSYPATGLGTTDETGEGDWLGRYGVLRNNWYNVSISGVAALGSPTVPELKYKYDDEIDSYICCKINILSWCKRTQDVDL